MFLFPLRDLSLNLKEKNENPCQECAAMATPGRDVGDPLSSSSLTRRHNHRLHHFDRFVFSSRSLASNVIRSERKRFTPPRSRPQNCWASRVFGSSGRIPMFLFSLKSSLSRSSSRAACDSPSVPRPCAREGSLFFLGRRDGKRRRCRCLAPGRAPRR